MDMIYSCIISLLAYSFHSDSHTNISVWLQIIFILAYGFGKIPQIFMHGIVLKLVTLMFTITPVSFFSGKCSINQNREKLCPIALLLLTL